jgi:hypothetical protein
MQSSQTDWQAEPSPSSMKGDDKPSPSFSKVCLSDSEDIRHFLLSSFLSSSALPSCSPCTKVTMPFVPTSFSKVFSNLRSTTTDNKLDITLFDDLPTSEKQAAIIKLQELAGQQLNAKKTFNWRNFLMAFMGLSFLVCGVIASVAIAIDVDADPSLVAKLRLANTNLDRMNLLPKDSDWLFDFTKQEKYTFSPGGVVNANAATFPATVGQGLTMVSEVYISSIHIH